MNEKKPVSIWLEEPRVDFDFPCQFCCSFSPLLRKVCVTVPQIKEFIREQCVSIVRYFEESPELCASLKTTNVVPQEGRVMRQMDIRNGADGPVVLKFFLSWEFDNDRWLVLVEMPPETYWEQNQVNPATN